MPKASPNDRTDAGISGNSSNVKRQLGRLVQFVTVTAHREGECCKCYVPIHVGDDIVWDKHNHEAFCTGCGTDESSLTD